MSGNKIAGKPRHMHSRHLLLSHRIGYLLFIHTRLQAYNTSIIIYNHHISWEKEKCGYLVKTVHEWIAVGEGYPKCVKGHNVGSVARQHHAAKATSFHGHHIAVVLTGYVYGLEKRPDGPVLLALEQVLNL